MISELEKQVLREAYPHLSFHDDLDIERYFELRNAGQMGTALSLYNNILKRKYPDDELRIRLLSLYRTKDPQFYMLLSENLRFLAANTITTIKRVIIYITDAMQDVHMNDVFSLIRNVENLLSQLKADRFAVIAECEKYSRFADMLNFRTAEMKQASEIIRMYVTDTISSVNEYRNEQNRIQQKELEQQKKQSLITVLDFSKIHFTDEQISLIVLPNESLCPEDKVLAYIIKYWERVFDRNFQNTVLLYSRKYKTPHYDIFNTIKIARSRAWQDSELLQAVLANVVSGYYYSISGDLYMNKMWQKMKPLLLSGNNATWSPAAVPLLIADRQQQNTGKQNHENISANISVETSYQINSNVFPLKNRIQHMKKTPHILKSQSTDAHFTRSRADSEGSEASTSSIQPRKLISDADLRAEQKKQAEKYALMKAEEKKYFASTPFQFKENAKKQAENEKAFLEKQRRERNVDTRIPVTVVVKNRSAGNISATQVTNTTKEKSQKLKKNASTNTRQRKTLSPRKAASYKKTTAKIENSKNSSAHIFVPRKNNNFNPNKTHSIEQMIKKETGKNYVIYQDVFFKTIRTSIRHILAQRNMNKRSLFNTEQNAAENIIYVFFERNYKNLYQEWESSNAKDEVYALGFNVQSLEPIIKHWAKEITEKNENK